MRCMHALPGGYRERLTIDLQKDRKTAHTVSIAAAVVMLALLWIGHRLVPIGLFLPAGEAPGMSFLRLLVMLLGMAAYLVLHELTHAAAMKLCGAGKLRFGFTGAYAYAGSEGDYFGKRAYAFIALAPLVLWTLLLTLPLLAVPRAWFWAVYFIQVANISGSAGDVYVTLRMAGLPETILIRDTGLNMTVYDHVRINIRNRT